MRRIALLLTIAAAILAAPGPARARPVVFAEGVVGVAVAVGNGGYTEEHEEASLQTGLRGGVWFSRIDNARSLRRRRLGAELQVDRTSYGASYFYYQDVVNSDGTTSTIRVDPEYRRMRALAGPRVAMPLHPIADIVLRAAGGIDRVSGTSEGIALVVEVGAQISIHLGPVRLGVELAIPVAFHDNEETETQGIGPQFGHRPGYNRAVDAIACATVGAVF